MWTTIRDGQIFACESDRIQAALGSRVLRIEHVGSTSIRSLAAKPVIDMLVVVADSVDEHAYVPALEAAEYSLRTRETDWFEHRMFKGPDTEVNLHVFSSGCPEIDRVLLFRDWLRSNPADRETRALAQPAQPAFAANPRIDRFLTAHYAGIVARAISHHQRWQFNAGVLLRHAVSKLNQ